MTHEEEKLKDLDRLLDVLSMNLNNIGELLERSGEFTRTGKLEVLQTILDELSKSCFAAAVTSKNASVIIKEALES